MRFDLLPMTMTVAYVTVVVGALLEEAYLPVALEELFSFCMR